METLFDHNPTREELDELFRPGAPEAELEALPRSNDTAMGEIVRLYQLRGDETKVAEYAALISDAEYRDDLLLVDLIS